MYIFPRILHLSSNRRERNSAHLFPVMTPARKLTHNMKFKHFWMQEDTNFGNAIIIHHFGPEICQNPTQKDTNFGNAMIIHHLGPEKCQKSYPERHEFQERHNSSLPLARELPKSNPERHEFQETALIDPSKKCQQIRKVFVFPEFRTIIEMHSLAPSTLTNQSLWEHLVACFLRLQTNCAIFGQ